MNWPVFIANTYFSRKQPLSIVHFLTDRCNARCPHCFMDFSKPVPSQDLLSLDEICAMTRTMGKGLYNVNLTGGEPFLREDLFEIVSAYFKNTTVRSIVITSNGTLTKAVGTFVDKLHRSDFRGRVKLSFSLDNFEREHDAHRKVKGAFQSVLEAYRIVEDQQDSRMTADILITVTPFNYGIVMDLLTSLKNRGIHNYSTVLMRVEGLVFKIENSEAVLRSYQNFSSRIQLELLSQQKRLSLHIFPEAIRSAKNIIARDIVTEMSRAPRELYPCFAGSLFGVIYPEGTVAPCETADDSYRFGNIRNTGLDFMRLWQEETASFQRKRLRKARCGCTYECAWSVNIPANISLMPKLAILSCKNLL